ncbi:MAG: mechanosensitive ion channel [Candidatus Nitrohelix vancouverensis]|uniref:Mechanosensitive ion channel n=1 Tax=Candidatus Nitrohelix vancouverensis TaxID=2705534 RepID=A0A7T0G4U8_9BACT|nr:MAG: mechanosensitive ion channel [Candidatus Nitrohelix vancouverensis]
MDILIEQLKTLWNLFSAPLFELGSSHISIASLFVVLTILAGFVIVSKIIERGVRSALKNKAIDPGIKGSIERFSRYITITLGAFIALDTIGISLTSLAALGAVLMVGIGFGLQNIAQNFISGIIILLERPIKQGDIVYVGGVSGKVLDIRVRSTIIETRDDVAIIVPNSQFIAEQVINDSFSGEKIRRTLKVGVAYGSDVEKVTEILMKVAEDQKQVLETPSAKVFFMDFGSSSLDFELRFWVNELWTTDGILSDLRYAVDREFRNAGVTIPFPQQDLHIKSCETNFKLAHESSNS